MKDKVLCIGEALIDFIPLEADVALKEVSGFKKMMGGAPTNVACAIAKLGGKVKLVTKVGSDAFGEYIIDELNNYTVDTSYVLKDENYDTSLAFVSLNGEGDREFKFYRKTAADLNIKREDIPLDILDDICILHFGSVDLVESDTKDTHDYLLRAAKMRDITISMDVNVRRGLWDNDALYQKTINEYLEYVDILKVSEDELSFITGLDDIDLSIKYLFDKGIKEVIYTMGASGARVYFDDMTYIETKGLKVNVVDTTGAGDAFMGTYLYFLSNVENKDLNHKVKAYMGLLLANKCAAYACMKYGAANSYISQEEII